MNKPFGFAIAETYSNLLIAYALFFVALMVIYAYRDVSFVDRFTRVCVAQCPERVWAFISPYRGNNYYIGKKTRDRCLVTIWSVTHYLMYMVLGYLFPNMFWETFALGLLFEVVEAATIDCHDIMDVVWNTLGFITGRYIRARV